MDVKLGRLD